MTFDAFESSTESSRPIEVIRFTVGADSYEYTSSEDEVVVDALTYTPIPIRRSKIKQTPEAKATVVTFSVHGSNVFARRYINIVPGSKARVTVKRVQRPDFPTPEVVTLFDGYVASVKFSEDGHGAEIAATPIASATSRTIPRFTYQSLCNNVLYDSSCKVDETDSTWRHTDQVLTVVGSTITVQGADGFVDGYFTGGFVESASGDDVRYITDHTGTSLQLMLPFASTVLGSNVTVLAGCDHSISTCDSKFNTTEDPTSNVINFAGHAFVPTRNIFRSGI